MTRTNQIDALEKARRGLRSIGPYTAGLIFGAFCLCVGVGLGAWLVWAVVT